MDEIDTRLDESGKTQLCADLQLRGAEFLVVICDGIRHGLNLCEFIKRAIITNQCVMVQNIKWVLAEVHTAVTKHSVVFLENGVFGVLLATAHQPGVKAFIAFHWLIFLLNFRASARWFW